MEGLVDQLLSKRPEDRPASALEVEQRLHVIADGGRADLAPTVPLIPVQPEETPAGTLAPPATLPYPAALPPPETRPATPPPGPARTRRPWVVAALALGGLLFAGLLLLPLLNRDVDTAAPAPSTTAPTVSAPAPTETAPATAPAPTVDPAGSAVPEPPADPLVGVRAAVDQAVADGEMDAKKAAEFRQRLADLAKKTDKGERDVSKQVDDLAKFLTELVKKGDLTPEASQRIQTALNQV